MSRIRVLIADPDEALLASYREYLSNYGFIVSTVRTALDCSTHLAGFGPDVLVLDPELPWGWGDGVLARMHEDPDMPVVPVMVLSSAHDLELLYRVFQFPVNDFELKPVEPSLLAQRLRRLVDSNPNRDRGNGRIHSSSTASWGNPLSKTTLS
ncbi:MAG: response regulator [Planctomycetota bacterium]|nr:response regulator [Planctomycetota bacterium]